MDESFLFHPVPDNYRRGSKPTPKPGFITRARVSYPMPRPKRTPRRGSCVEGQGLTKPLRGCVSLDQLRTLSERQLNHVASKVLPVQAWYHSDLAIQAASCGRGPRLQRSPPPPGPRNLAPHAPGVTPPSRPQPARSSALSRGRPGVPHASLRSRRPPPAFARLDPESSPQFSRAP